MTDNEDGKLPARSRKPVDADAQAERAGAPSVGVDKLRDLQRGLEQPEDSDR